jgi:NTE family protein
MSARAQSIDLRGPFSRTALVLQGGGALGAYQAGVYEALAEHSCKLDWISGISIGAVNSAIIAGNTPERRVERLREFWNRITSSFVWPAPKLGDSSRRIFDAVSSLHSLTAGQPDFFAPRIPPASVRPHGAPGASSIYDTAPLRQTLLDLIDFDLLNSGATRLTLGAVNVVSGNFAYFDTTNDHIRPEHVMASGALPPGFPSIEIDGQYYWDGGLVSNTPLVPVLEGGREDDTLVFQVDLFSARGDIPGDLVATESRRKQISFSSRTRLNIDHYRQRQQLRQAIVKLFDHLPPELKQDEEMRELRDLGDGRSVAIVRLIYRRQSYEGVAIDFEFSRASMLEHWKAGLNDARRTLARSQWLDDRGREKSVKVFDLTRD